MSDAPRQRPPDDVPAEVRVDAEVVQRLLAEQHPDLAELPLRWLAEGWDNVLFRVGEDLIARLPRRELGARWLEKEVACLPVLAPRLPVAVPVPQRIGRPGQGYPYPWSLTPYFSGGVAGRSPPLGPGFSGQLAAFLHALHQPAADHAIDNPFRSVHPRQRDSGVRDRLSDIDVDARRVLGRWDQLSAAPAWTGPRMWVHGDLHPFNVLVRGGELAAVLDWGDLFTGDPAPDLASAWMLLEPAAHAPVFAGYDPATLQRGKAWGLFFGVMLTHAGLRGAGSHFEAVGRRTLARVLA